MIIVAERTSQLGNRLVVFSHLIAFAQKYNVRIANPAFGEYAPLFGTTRDDLFCCYPPVHSPIKINSERRTLLFRLARRIMGEAEKKRFPFIRVYRLPDGQTLDLDAEFAKVARRNIVFIDGYFFRKPDGVSESAPALREYFRPTETAQKNVQQLIQSARAECDVLIGIHLRQGDYREYRGGQYFYTSVQYAAILARAEALFAPSRVGFLLCSNEPQEAELFAGFSVTFGTGNLLEDMYALAECDAIIGPPSTFTAWSSFYGSVPLCRIFTHDAAFTREDFHLAQDKGWVS